MVPRRCLKGVGLCQIGRGGGGEAGCGGGRGGEWRRIEKNGEKMRCKYLRLYNLERYVVMGRGANSLKQGIEVWGGRAIMGCSGASICEAPIAQGFGRFVGKE